MLMMLHYPDLGSASDLSCSDSKFASAYQKHDLVLESRFSDVISQGKQWRHHKMSAVFSG